jgi:GlpG protein
MVPMNVVLMLGWLVACMTPLIPNVANGAHLGGLFAGMLAALIGRAIRR